MTKIKSKMYSDRQRFIRLCLYYTFNALKRRSFC